MKKLSSTVLLALIGLFALSVDARAQEKSVVATVPHAFVAAGKTFPAGTYTISPVTSDTQPVLKIRNNETAQSAAFLLPVSAGDAVDHSGLTFKRVGGCVLPQPDRNRCRRLYPAQAQGSHQRSQR